MEAKPKSARAVIITSSVAACLMSPALFARGMELPMSRHMQIQMAVQEDPHLPRLPSFRIDSIHTMVPLDDRLDADEAFDRPFVEALAEGLTWYLARRGLRIVRGGEEIRIVGTITSYEGNRGWGDWGVEVGLDLKFFRGQELLSVKSLRSHLNYSDDEEVVDEEKAKYKAQGLRVSFPEVLFTRVGADLGEKLILLLEEEAETLTSPPPPAGSEAADSRGTLSIDANVAHAEVFIDGGLVGTTPLRDLKLDAGTHLLEIRKEGHSTWRREIRVLEGARSNFFAELLEGE